MKKFKRIIFFSLLLFFVFFAYGFEIIYYDVYNDDFYLVISGRNKDGDIILEGFKEGKEKANLVLYPTIEYRKTPDGSTFSAYIVGIGGEDFENEYILESVSFEDSEDSKLSGFGSLSFNNCLNLKEINFPYSVTYLNGFTNCVSLKEISILGVETIASTAFTGCKNLKKVIMGFKIISIQDFAFANCKEKLEVFILAQTPPWIGEDVFWGLSEYSIYVPKDTIDLYKAEKSWQPYVDHLKSV